MSNNIVTIETEEGESIDIKFDEMGNIKRISLLMQSPPEFREITDQAAEMEETEGEVDPHKITIGPKALDYILYIIETQTVLDRGLIDELPVMQTQKLMLAALQQLGGQEIDIPEDDDSVDTDQFRMEADDFEFEMNDDGTVDLDDWR